MISSSGCLIRSRFRRKRQRQGAESAAMIPRELLKKIRHIEIRTKRLVNDLFSGRIPFHLQGAGNGVRGSAAVSAGRRYPADRLECHGAYRLSVREEVPRGTRALGGAAGGRVEFRSFWYPGPLQERHRRRIVRAVCVLGDQEQRQGRADYLHRPDREVRAARRRGARTCCG